MDIVLDKYIISTESKEKLVTNEPSSSEDCLESERDYRRAVFRYRRRYGEYQDRQIAETGDYFSAFHAANADTAPPFDYHAISLSQAVGAHIPQFMVLVLYSVLFFFAAQIAFIRTPL